MPQEQHHPRKIRIKLKCSAMEGGRVVAEVTGRDVAVREEAQLEGINYQRNYSDTKVDLIATISQINSRLEALMSSKPPQEDGTSKDIISSENQKDDRTGTGLLSKFGSQLRSKSKLSKTKGSTALAKITMSTDKSNFRDDHHVGRNLSFILWYFLGSTRNSSLIMVRPAVRAPVQSPLGAPPVLGQGFALPGEDGGAEGGQVRVSMRTAVWMVVWKEPVTRAPLKDWDGPNSARQDMSPGISTSASSISSRPKSPMLEPQKKKCFRPKAQEFALKVQEFPNQYVERVVMMPHQFCALGTRVPKAPSINRGPLMDDNRQFCALGTRVPKAPSINRGPLMDDNRLPFNEREDCVADYKESFNYPPGYRFAPTDNELAEDYLDPKLKRRRLQSNVIHEVDLYDYNPKNLTGQRPDRAAGNGYWKPTGVDQEVKCGDGSVALKKSLDFYEGKHPDGKRTLWKMHEYRFDKEDDKRGPQHMKNTRGLKEKDHAEEGQANADSTLQSNEGIPLEINAPGSTSACLNTSSATSRTPSGDDIVEVQADQVKPEPEVHYERLVPPVDDAALEDSGSDKRSLLDDIFDGLDDLEEGGLAKICGFLVVERKAE
ncbi:hypothetical protein RJ640_010788 [Escallonia rubra]|uniref:NAC domain-containing protein n=1 Tax=Escallonia rubra TaxID=112253 RepID=A0AA88R0P0_9ASTE|nr:hypothetical protein RJ640_010788 [Escallonia rubra]